MRFLCCGLSKTGTKSLHKAMQILGFNSKHWCPEIMRDLILFDRKDFNFSVYKEYDVISDIPEALFYKEFLSSYPNCKFILTIRDTQDWLLSIKHHYEINVDKKIKDNILLEEAKITQQLAYGSKSFSKELYSKNYKKHNSNVLLTSTNTLVMNICDGDGWNVLCPFVQKDIPKTTFPWENHGSNTRILDREKFTCKRNSFYKIFC